MNAKAALCLALLEGRVLNVMNCFQTIGLTNIAREIPRMVEDEFEVEVSRVPMVGKNRYGSPTNYVNYRLNKIPANLEGIAKMKEYVREQKATDAPPRTEKEATLLKQTDLFLNS